jgi:flagellar motility protein MotE (MotC chaperone)
MRKGDIIAIVLVALVTFPVLYLGMLFANGTLRVEYGFKKQDEEQVTRVEEVRHSARRDSLAAQNTKIFEAIRQERADLAREQERLTEQYSRLEMLQADIESKRGELVRERTQLESKLARVPEEETARVRKLARIYEAMKPGEAAGILETMPDAQVAQILSAMGDDRQKGRIMSLLTKEKAARLNRLIR